jgi:hypothetical protein
VAVEVVSGFGSRQKELKVTKIKPLRLSLHSVQVMPPKIGGKIRYWTAWLKSHIRFLKK